MGQRKVSGSFFIKPSLNTKKQKPVSQAFRQPSSLLETSLPSRKSLDKNNRTAQQDKTEPTPTEHEAFAAGARDPKLSPTFDLTESAPCKAWLNNFCDRGDKCKLKHLTDPCEIMKVKKVCMAYQQPWGCKSDTCYYIHLTRKERRAIIEGSLKRENFHSDLEQRFFHRPPPMCEGECWGYSCKFRHIIGTGKDRRIVNGAQMNASSERKRKTDPVPKPDIKTYYDPCDKHTDDAAPYKYDKKICRSWVNHFCYEKDKCKLIHPPKDFSFLLGERQICRDWQRNKVCRFKKCKFFHATEAEVELLKKHKLRRDNFTPDQKYRFFGQKMTKEEEMLHKEKTYYGEMDDEEVIRKKKRHQSDVISKEGLHDCTVM